MSLYRGVSVENDFKFGDAQEKLRKSIKTSSLVNKVIDCSKISENGIRVLKMWITSEVKKILGYDDDIVVNLIVNELNVARKDRGNKCKLNGVDLQVLVTPFMENDAAGFITDLYRLLLNAVGSKTGVPDLLVLERARELENSKNVQNSINIVNNTSSSSTGDSVKVESSVKVEPTISNLKEEEPVHANHVSGITTTNTNSSGRRNRWGTGISDSTVHNPPSTSSNVRDRDYQRN